MNIITLTQKIIKREDLKANRAVAYLFGDNLAKIGYGGQAKEMRGEPNAVGIPTKKYPDNNPSSFMNDSEYEDNIQVINEALDNLHDFGVVVIPADSIGTGLSRLNKYAPNTLKYLKSKLHSLLTEGHYQDVSIFEDRK